ncbi:MAG: class I SAM-dependent methyltransferase [Nitrospiraceae bacterium]
MAISKQEVSAIYQPHAKRYDFALQLYRLIGSRIEAYRLRAVELLRLKHGDCVVDLACGTGLSFPLILDRIGSEGRLIGVDLSPGMLACARERVDCAGWKNVELVPSDMATYHYPERVNAVLTVGALGYVPEYEHVIERAKHALVPGGRLVILDGKWPERWPFWLLKVFVWLFRPFGLTLDYFDSHPWESVARLFVETAFEEMYGGAIYVSSGTVPSSAA